MEIFLRFIVLCLEKLLVNSTKRKVRLSDGDFLDLDWSFARKTDRCVILFHGLEGSAQRHYCMLGAAKIFK